MRIKKHFKYLLALTKAQSRKRARRAADNEVIGLWLKQMQNIHGPNFNFYIFNW